MSKIKVLIMVDCVHRDSGITSFILNSYVSDKEFQFDYMMVWGEDDVISELKNRGSKIYYMPHPIKEPFHFIKYINGFFKKKNYDIIHSHTCQFDKYVFSVAKKYSDTKAISHSHSSKFSEYRLKALVNRVATYNITDSADYYFACSVDSGTRLFGKDILRNKRFHIIYNGIDCNRFKFSELKRSMIREELNISDEPLMGYIANLSLVKNHYFLIDILQVLVQRNKNYKLLIVGNGKLERQIREYISKKNLRENVLMLGKRSDIPEILSAIDVFVMPSKFEGLPLSCLEAEAVGLPLILSDRVTSEVQIINCTTLSLEQSAEEWADVVEEKICGNYDKNEANDAVKKSNYSIDSSRTKLMQIYRNIVSYR